MTKEEELNNPKSCLNKAWLNEMMFILLGRDEAAPATIRFWKAERIRLGLNKQGDPQLVEALDCANLMEMQKAKGM